MKKTWQSSFLFSFLLFFIAHGESWATVNLNYRSGDYRVTFHLPQTPSSEAAGRTYTEMELAQLPALLIHLFGEESPSSETIRGNLGFRLSEIRISVSRVIGPDPFEMNDLPFFYSLVFLANPEFHSFSTNKMLGAAYWCLMANRLENAIRIMGEELPLELPAIFPVKLEEEARESILAFPELTGDILKRVSETPLAMTKPRKVALLFSASSGLNHTFQFLLKILPKANANPPKKSTNPADDNPPKKSTNPASRGNRRLPTSELIERALAAKARATEATEARAREEEAIRVKAAQGRLAKTGLKMEKQALSATPAEGRDMVFEGASPEILQARQVITQILEDSRQNISPLEMNLSLLLESAKLREEHQWPFFNRILAEPKSEFSDQAHVYERSINTLFKDRLGGKLIDAVSTLSQSRVVNYILASENSDFSELKPALHRVMRQMREIPSSGGAESGERISGQVVFDARGMAPFQTSECGYQKFVGIDLDLEEPHGIENPIIMDATCEQKDGFRFFYLIPWASNRILIEDTRYSNSSMIHLDEFHNEILEFCRKKNWKIKTIVRTESAALPIPLQASPSQLSAHGPVNIGLRAGYFHLTTGYSLANAASAAEKIADTFVNHPEGNIQRIHAELEALTQPIRKQAQFFALLNRMLFKAAVPERRWIIFSRFYRLSEELIFRFYRGSLKRTDQFRILMGKPPVPILSARRQINP